MTPPKIKPDAGRPAVEAVLAVLSSVALRQAQEPLVETTTLDFDKVDRETLALATRYLLQRFEQAQPGHTVEVRVPPFGAVQAVEGPRHTRGTPPNVVELAPADWVALATGHASWESLVKDARVSASGTRSNISDLLPLAEW